MLNLIAYAAACVAMSSGPLSGDAADDIGLVLSQPMEVTLDPAAFDPDTGVARAEAFPMPDGAELQIQIGTQRLEGLDLFQAPLVLMFDEAPAWEGNTQDGFAVIYPDPGAIAEHLRRPDRAPMCGSRQLQTYVLSSLGERVPVAVALTGGLLFSEGAHPDDADGDDDDDDVHEAPEGDGDPAEPEDGGGGLQECKIEIIEHGSSSWTTHCEPHECDLGGGAVGICGPTPLSQCACARKPEPEPIPEEVLMWLLEVWFPFLPW